MRIGRLSERITLQYDAGTTRDDYGNEDADWQALAQVWAGLEHLRGAEIFAAEQVAAEKVVRFRIRYRDDVTERNRIQWSDKWWNITYVQELGRRQGLLITARSID